MKRLNEQGTIADIPLRSMSKLYYVRTENDEPVDEGWITVDEARRVNSSDRRMFGSAQNRYFQDKQSADAFTQSQGAPMDDMGMGAPDDFGADMEEPMPDEGMPEEEPMDDMGDMGDDLGGDIDFDASEFEGDDFGGDEMDFEPEGEPDDLLGDLGGDEGFDDLGDTSDDLLGDVDEDDGVLEIRVPRRIKLVPESMGEGFRQGNPFGGWDPESWEEPESTYQTYGPGEIVSWRPHPEAQPQAAKVLQGNSDGTYLISTQPTVGPSRRYKVQASELMLPGPMGARESMQERIPTFRGEPRMSFDPEAGSEGAIGSMETPDDFEGQLSNLIREETGKSLYDIADALSPGDADYLMNIVDEAEQRGDSPYKALAILHDFHPYKQFMHNEPEGEEEPWSEAPTGNVNPAQYQMLVSQRLMTTPEGPQITRKMMNDPQFYEQMSQVMMDAITRGADPEETAQKIVDLYNRGGRPDWAESQETTEDGVVEALLSGDLSTSEAVEEQMED